ncbi:SUMF1/EgtB/PvdO family nonheme iron enzyme, partial [Bacteroidota bacterium]
FKKDPTDLAAIRDSRKDINDNQCAIIKILTDLVGIKIDANLGIEGNIIVKSGEYWAYVSPGEKRIQISKSGFIPLYYTIPVPIESQCVYVMVLTYQLKEEPIEVNKLGFILIESVPEGADVFIDGQSMGQVTPFQQAMNQGEYEFTLKKDLHNDYIGTFKVTSNETTILRPHLLPNFGILTVNSLPEQGASITIDNKNINQLTPYSKEKIAPGKYTITLRKELYEPLNREFEVIDGDTITLNLELTPTFGEITITTNPKATIFIDNLEKATGSFSGRINKGSHLIEVRNDKFFNQQKSIEVIAGQKESYDFILKPKTGILSIMTNPPQADIYINDKYYDKTPRFINDLIIGEYEVKLSKEGFADKTIIVIIKENETTMINEQLQITEISNSKTNESYKDSIEMILVKGDTFQMGNNEGYQIDEAPMHTVNINNFFIGKYEVTQKLWREIMDNNPSYFSGCDSCPVENVSWENVQEFIQKLNIKTGLSYRLPTEAEWEYAARGGSQSNGSKYSGGNDPAKVAWYWENSDKKTHIVGTKIANELCVFDMSGNVWEWCNDWYDEGYYKKSPEKNPKGPTKGKYRILRGNSWYDNSKSLQVTNRNRDYPVIGDFSRGFRIARTP